MRKIITILQRTIRRCHETKDADDDKPLRNSAARKLLWFATVHAVLLLQTLTVRLALQFHIYSCRHRVIATPKRKNFISFSNSAGIV